MKQKEEKVKVCVDDLIHGGILGVGCSNFGTWMKVS